jgi:hypothetical protein
MKPVQSSSACALRAKGAPARLNQFMETGNKLRDEVLRTWNNQAAPQDLIRRADEWTNAVRAFLVDELPHYAGFFVSDSGFTDRGFVGVSNECSQCAVGLDNRLQRLGQILLKLEERR